MRSSATFKVWIWGCAALCLWGCSEAGNAGDEPTCEQETTYYQDVDGDGFGVSSQTQLGCVAPLGFAAQDGDCNDSNAAVHPMAVEVCDNADNNCNGIIDSDALEKPIWYLDTDEDGFGGQAQRPDCQQPEGYTATSDDCDDGDGRIYPGAMELCDSKDNDCDGVEDEDLPQETPLWFQDSDQDGFGDPLVFQRTCSPPDGFVSNDTDCDDTRNAVNPDADEICNDNLDNNCNASADQCAFAPQISNVTAFSTVIYGLERGSWTGHEIDGVPDTDEDGKDEIIVGAAFRGKSYLVRGGQEGATLLDGITLFGVSVSFDTLLKKSSFGARVANDECRTGAFVEVETNMVHVVCLEMLTDDVVTISRTVSTGLFCGDNSSLLGGGDINGDGYSDLLVGNRNFQNGLQVQLLKGPIDGPSEESSGIVIERSALK